MCGGEYECECVCYSVYVCEGMCERKREQGRSKGWPVSIPYPSPVSLAATARFSCCVTGHTE